MFLLDNNKKPKTTFYQLDLNQFLITHVNEALKYPVIGELCDAELWEQEPDWWSVVPYCITQAGRYSISLSTPLDSAVFPSQYPCDWWGFVSSFDATNVIKMRFFLPLLLLVLLQSGKFFVSENVFGTHLVMLSLRVGLGQLGEKTKQSENVGPKHGAIICFKLLWLIFTSIYKLFTNFIPLFSLKDL